MRTKGCIKLIYIYVQYLYVTIICRLLYIYFPVVILITFIKYILKVHCCLDFISLFWTKMPIM
jgi:hypothetical protein